MGSYNWASLRITDSEYQLAYRPVSVSIFEYHWESTKITQYHWVLLSIKERHFVSLSVAGFRWVSVLLNEHQRAPLSSNEHHWVFMTSGEYQLGMSKRQWVSRRSFFREHHQLFFRVLEEHSNWKYLARFAMHFDKMSSYVCHSFSEGLVGFLFVISNDLIWRCLSRI